MALEAHGYSGAQRSEKLEQLIGDFYVDHIRDSYGYALSGGERRRGNCARLGRVSKILLLMNLCRD